MKEYEIIKRRLENETAQAARIAELENAMTNAARNQSASNEENRQLKTALKAMVINAEYKFPHFEDETTEAHAALVHARELLDMGEPPKDEE